MKTCLVTMSILAVIAPLTIYLLIQVIPCTIGLDTIQKLPLLFGLLAGSSSLFIRREKKNYTWNTVNLFAVSNFTTMFLISNKFLSSCIYFGSE